MRIYKIAGAIMIIAAIAVTAEASGNAPLTFLRNQIRPSGLIDSFVEDNTDYSYTYDNALAAMAFCSSGNYTLAAKILDAFAAIGPQPEGGFLHRYHANDRTPANGILRVGHNAYLIQAINMYYAGTKNAKYNKLALTIANYILSQQASDGGIYGGAGITWKSTENNLAALCAIHNLGVGQKLSYYTDRAEAIRGFLTAECWTGTNFLRGENDATIVTDVQALGAIVLGPVYKNSTYWIKQYTLNTKKYSGNKTVTGFDQNTDRDTIWTEGTLQESLAYMAAQDISNFNYYKTEAQKLIQTSGGLLQASNAGTAGDGDTFQRWQAVAPTAWYVLVSNQDNAFALQ